MWYIDYDGYLLIFGCVYISGCKDCHNESVVEEEKASLSEGDALALGLPYTNHIEYHVVCYFFFITFIKIKFKKFEMKIKCFI